MSEANYKLNKRKRTRYYEVYLSKLMKQVSPENGITSNSKQQLNSILCSITRIISSKVEDFTEISKKKTISEREVINALQVMFSGELVTGMLKVCEQAVKKYQHEDPAKGIPRQDRAGIIFPPSVTEKYLRNFGNSKIMVGSGAPVALAAAIEYLAGEILEDAVLHAKQYKRVRITVRDLEIGVRTDPEINSFFEQNNLVFLGGGVVPYVHPSLLTKKPRKRRCKKSGERQSHRYRPGTVAVREIRRFQKISNCFTLAKYPFEKYTRAIIEDLIDDDTKLKISKEVFTILQYFVEQRMISLLKKSYRAAIHTGRVKLIVPDIEFVRSLEGEIPIEHVDTLVVPKTECIENPTAEIEVQELEEFT